MNLIYFTYIHFNATSRYSTRISFSSPPQKKKNLGYINKIHDHIKIKKGERERERERENIKHTHIARSRELKRPFCNHILARSTAPLYHVNKKK
jgi:hypothetical protein